ncbi:DUF488 domain-containing protein [Micromonospora sp. SH-82]|uniref:DUF488 domain-containing protein n=1 Tax=Micromonospora sp. SH-82 TaxID=3132938 RepID=UPI003EB94609
MSAIAAVGDRTGVLGVGYEGRSIGEFVTGLVSLGVNRLVDVRLMPLSRKRGFSKSAISQALNERGIRYEHLRELGNPKENRPGFAGTPAELESARQAYADLLDRPESIAALDELASAAQDELVALLCFEADESRCHRHVVMRALKDRSATVWASTPPTR